ncbi:gp53-like domain-containing protein [Escherichia coli]|uniref:gp53-like domain-containing protein n=1 Tax=Escherichia coli TaxID=562 RepID=UPI001CE081B3|nr:phage tail protein [Escherichia coli]
MAINNFKPFALDPNANVTSQADWEALPALLSGFTAGKASSAQVNKAIRQASFIAAALAQYTANKSGLDVLDDGDLNGFISKMGTAFGKDFQALDATLSALAGLATGANKLPYFTGNDTAAQTDLTSVGRDIIGKNTIADILTYLGLGDISAAGVATGSLGSAGYATFPILISGVRQTFIMQWGTLTPLRSGGTVDINLPIAFPTAAMQAYATHDNTTQITRPTVYAISTTSRTTITATAICLNTESVGAAATRSSDEVACYGRYFVIGY